MNRNYSFEAGYLINLTLLVLGALSLPVIKNYISLYVAYFFFAITSVHLVIFNLSYFFENSTPFEIESINKLNKISRFSFGSVSITFVYVFFHVPLNYVSKSLLKNQEPIISFLVPLILTALILFFIVKRKIYEKIIEYRNIEIELQPSKISVFPSYDETQRMILRITNNSEKEREFKINISAPEGVTMRYQNMEGEELNITERASKGKIPLDIDLKYDEEERKSDLIEIEIKHQDMKEKKKVIANCFP